MRLKFVHLPKSRQFHMPYRFHDPDKEEMKDREERIKSELGIREKKEVDKNYRPNIKGQFRYAQNRGVKSDEKARRDANWRLFFLILFLVIVFYLLLK